MRDKEVGHPWRLRGNGPEKNITVLSMGWVEVTHATVSVGLKLLGSLAFYH